MKCFCDFAIEKEIDMRLFQRACFGWLRSRCLVVANVILISLLFFVGKAAFLEERAVRSANTDSITLLGVLSESMCANSDLMMRFSHYTDAHPSGGEIMFCPECSRGKGSRFDSYTIAGSKPDDDTPWGSLRSMWEWWSGGYRQSLSQDAIEVQRGIRGISEGMLIQRQALRYTLSRMREASPSGVGYVGGG